MAIVGRGISPPSTGRRRITVPPKRKGKGICDEMRILAEIACGKPLYLTCGTCGTRLCGDCWSTHRSCERSMRLGYIVIPKKSKSSDSKSDLSTAGGSASTADKDKEEKEEETTYVLRSKPVTVGTPLELFTDNGWVYGRYQGHLDKDSIRFTLNIRLNMAVKKKVQDLEIILPIKSVFRWPAKDRRRYG